MELYQLVYLGVLAAYLLVINVIGFLSMSIDKKRALNGEWRIKESMLLSIAFAGGGIGSYVGMQVKRHKTKHKKFTIGVPVAMVVSYLILGIATYFIFTL